MLFGHVTVLIRGGGDLATGVAVRLHRSGFPVVVTELPRPLTVRRTVAFSTAVTAGSVVVEGVTARLVDPEAVAAAHEAGEVAVIVSPGLVKLDVSPDVVVDARLAKRNIDTSRDDAPLVIALGPGFRAGLDCDAVIETARGHRLGSVIWDGPAEADTGTPGIVAGRGRERVLRAPAAGPVRWTARIGDVVKESAPLGTVGDSVVTAPFDGLVRGLIADGTEVATGLKIGDVDPRIDPAACHQISDKSLAIAGGVTEAVLTWLNRSA